ncbi:MAG: hypothetical protein JXL97_02615 [Bacteroidales bacterium]|nr:hypothetical protein [Bacteroidales bacterium]
MTSQQASEIVKILKGGKEYKSGHYHYGYIYYYFSNDKFFKKREDLSVNIFEPTIDIEEFTEQNFIEHLVNEADFEEFCSNIQ